MINIKNKLESLGFIVKSIKNSKINRCATIYKTDKLNGWFKILDESVSYGTWDNTIENGYFWINENNFNKLTFIEKKEYKNRLFEQQKKIDEEDKKQRIESLKNSYDNHLVPINVSNAYLSLKKCLIRDDFKLDQHGNLIIPMFNIKNQLTGYQIISNNGDKKFKTGTILKDSFYPIKPYVLKISDLSLIFLCEGVATGLSIYDALNEKLDAIDFGVIACFSANNVDNIYSEINKEFGKKDILSIKDLDIAGLNVKCKGFSVGIQEGEDANDIYCKFGKDVLTKIIIERMKLL